MAKEAKKDYFSCKVTRPLYSTSKEIGKLNRGDRFFVENDEGLYIKTDIIEGSNIKCISDQGVSRNFDSKKLVTHVHGVKYSFIKLSTAIIMDVKSDGYLLYRTDLYPD